jgi:hypothetical protein
VTLIDKTSHLDASFPAVRGVGFVLIISLSLSSPRHPILLGVLSEFWGLSPLQGLER